MRRFIKLSMASRRRLARVFGCTEKMVYLALTYRKETLLARKIRYTAVKQFGGVRMVEQEESSIPLTANMMKETDFAPDECAEIAIPENTERNERRTT